MSEILQIYADLVSEPSRSVLAFCKLSGIDFELKLIDLFKLEFLTPEFTEINPFQAVPAIVHGSYKLNESAAIIAYLADAYNIDNEWYPKDIKIRGRINAFLHWHHQGIRERKDEYLMPKIVLPSLIGSSPPTEEEEVKLRQIVIDMLKNFESMLSVTGFAARTSGPTIADIFAYSEIANVSLLQIDIGEFPQLKSWYENIGANPIVSELHEALRKMVAQNSPNSDN